MAVPTDPTELQAAAACYCFNEETSERIYIYLLAQIAGLGAVSPSDLAELAACYCFDKSTATKIIAYLLCQSANAATPGGDCENLEGAGDPT